MERAKGREVHRILKAHGQRGWVELTRRYGKSFRHGLLVATCEPEVVRALLMDRVHAETRPPVHRLMGMFPGSDGILFMDGEPWLKRTRALMPVFHQQNVDAYPAMVRDTTLAHVTRWAQQERVADLYDAVQQLGAAMILKMGFGLEPDDPPAAHLARTMIDFKRFTTRPQHRHRLDEFGVLPSKILALPWILVGLCQLWKKARDVERAVDAVVAGGRVGNERPNWIGRLQEAGFGRKELAEELNHLYTAYNAIDYVTTGALYELARDRALAAALRAEIVSALGAREPATREDLPRLRHTHAFILEVLRRYPVTMGVVRLTGKPLEVGGETVPTGTQVVILLHALHHHPDFWEDPERLKPERWLVSPEPRVPFSYVPFLHGSRKCIGRAMAEMQLLVVLTTIVRRFDLFVYGDAVVPPFMIPRFGREIPFALSAATPVAG